MRQFIAVAFALVTLIFSSLGCEKGPQVVWEGYKPEVMQDALRNNQPVLAYFYAAWCPPCFELKKRTFNDPEVVARLNHYRRIKFDMSYRHSERIIALHQEYKVRGLPHMILMVPGTPESEWLRISGFVSPKRFLQFLELFEQKSQANT